MSEFGKNYRIIYDFCILPNCIKNRTGKMESTEDHLQMNGYCQKSAECIILKSE